MSLNLIYPLFFFVITSALRIELEVNKILGVSFNIFNSRSTYPTLTALSSLEVNIWGSRKYLNGIRRIITNGRAKAAGEPFTTQTTANSIP